MRPFRFQRTAFYTIWTGLTQWRYARIFLFFIFILWVKDGSVDATTFQPLGVVMLVGLATGSLLDVILMLVPSKTLIRATRTVEEQAAFERLGCIEAEP